MQVEKRKEKNARDDKKHSHQPSQVRTYRQTCQHFNVNIYLECHHGRVLSGSPPPSGHGKLKLSAASEKETVQAWNTICTAASPWQPLPLRSHRRARGRNLALAVATLRKDHVHFDGTVTGHVGQHRTSCRTGFGGMPAQKKNGPPCPACPCPCLNFKAKALLNTRLGSIL